MPQYQAASASASPPPAHFPVTTPDEAAPTTVNPTDCPVPALVNALPQYQQEDAQTITPEAMESIIAALASMEIAHKAETQLFQNDAQTITPEAMESIITAVASIKIAYKATSKKKTIASKGACQTWEDPAHMDWPESDSRLFCGNLGNEVDDDVLTKAFSRFPSFNMARVVRDKKTGKTKGYGFVRFSNPSDLAAALKGMHGKFVGDRPIKLRKSSWDLTDTKALEGLKHHSQQRPNLLKESALPK